MAVVRRPSIDLLMLIRASVQMVFHICKFLIFAIFFVSLFLYYNVSPPSIFYCEEKHH